MRAMELELECDGAVCWSGSIRVRTVCKRREEERRWEERYSETHAAVFGL